MVADVHVVKSVTFFYDPCISQPQVLDDVALKDGENSQACVVLAERF